MDSRAVPYTEPAWQTIIETLAQGIDQDRLHHLEQDAVRWLTIDALVDDGFAAETIAIEVADDRLRRRYDLVIDGPPELVVEFKTFRPLLPHFSHTTALGQVLGDVHKVIEAPYTAGVVLVACPTRMHAAFAVRPEIQWPVTAAEECTIDEAALRCLPRTAQNFVREWSTGTSIVLRCEARTDRAGMVYAAYRAWRAEDPRPPST